MSSPDWYAHTGPHWWTRHTNAVRRHLDAQAIELGSRVIAAQASQEAAPWNWKQAFPKTPPKGQMTLTDASAS